MKPKFRIHSEDLVSALESLESYFKDSGASIIQAAFHHTDFVHPNFVLNDTPLFPYRARRRREHYSGIDKVQSARGELNQGIK